MILSFLLGGVSRYRIVGSRGVGSGPCLPQRASARLSRAHVLLGATAIGMDLAEPASHHYAALHPATGAEQQRHTLRLTPAESDDVSYRHRASVEPTRDDFGQ